MSTEIDICMLRKSAHVILFTAKPVVGYVFREHKTKSRACIKLGPLKGGKFDERRI